MKQRPTLRQRIRDKRKRLATRPHAYRNARDLAAAVGPEAIAAEYGLGTWRQRGDNDVWEPGTDEEIAAGYAEICAIDEARDHARRGALEGFEEWRRSS